VIAGLAALWLLAAPQAGPVAEPAVTAAMRRPFAEADAELQRLGEAGSVGAQALHDGYTALRRRDFPAACRLWEAAAGVSAEAAHMTAECYEHGHGGTTDVNRAIELYRSAGDGGYPKSLCALGLIYMEGEAVPADPARGVALCRRGAEAGDPDAQTDLGNFYLAGRGVAEDKVEARRWYERAAEQNQRNALYTLGQMYWNGDTVEKDNDEAARLWGLAYEAGRTDAALPLGRAAMVKAMADRNNPDAVTLREAERWFGIAIPEIRDAAERAEAEQHLALVRRLLVLLAEREAAS
jgi:uncharacterized protein